MLANSANTTIEAKNRASSQPGFAPVRVPSSDAHATSGGKLCRRRSPQAFGRSSFTKCAFTQQSAQLTRKTPSEPRQTPHNAVGRAGSEPVGGAVMTENVPAVSPVL